MPRPSWQPAIHLNPRAASSGPSRLRAVLLATSALACVALTPAARAADATWLANPANGSFNDPANWVGGQLPSVTSTAFFGSSSQHDVTISGLNGTSLIALQLNSGSGDYNFTISSGLAFGGSSRSQVGILSQPGSGKATFNIGNSAAMQFLNAATAGNATIIINNSFAPGGVLFEGSSTADHATIAGTGQVSFFQNSTAANATISDSALGMLASFADQSTAGNATITAVARFSDTSTAGTATFIASNKDRSSFMDDASADHSNILIHSDTGISFGGNSTAGNATITNHGLLDFFDNSTLGNASIASDGRILIEAHASGGAARLVMTSAASTLDISRISSVATGTTLGSIEGSGKVFLGSKNLAVGGNDRSTAFAGVIQDGASNGPGPDFVGGSLTKAGKGIFTLTGINTYTGATTVDGGALVVDGSIAASSGVTVNAGAVLAGTGTVASTIVNGGTLVAGHSDGTFGTLTVQGSLSFTSAAAYLVQVSPQQAGSTSVTGAATLGGATVSAVFAPGSYVSKQYVILNANGGINGTFGQLINTNLPANFTAGLSYGANAVTLNLQMLAGSGGGGPGSSPPLNVNQQNVANGLVNSFNTMGGIPLVFATLSPAGLTQVSGETAVGAQQATFDAMNQFMGVLLDPTAGGRSDGATADAYAWMPRKAPAAADTHDPRWSVWAAGYGGSQSTDGDTAIGSSRTTSTVFGSAAGAEYRLLPGTVAGFALGGGGTSFRVGAFGSGSSDLFQAGAYLRHNQGPAFLAAALAYGWQEVTTNRTVTVAGVENLRGRFSVNAVSGRIEGGYRFATALVDLKPYAAGQFASFLMPSYAEQVISGAGPFALGYGSKDVTTARTELGVKTERAMAWTDTTVMLRGRLAWAHDYGTGRALQATFQTLPGSTFVVNGAQPAADALLTSVSAELDWRNGWSATATFDSEMSGTTRSYAGKGTVRYTW